MKTAIAWALIALGMIPSLEAGLTLVQQVEGSGQSGQISIQLSDSMARVDLGAEVTKIVNLTTGDETTLMHEAKTFMVLPASTSAALAERVQEMQKENSPKGAPTDPPKLVDTGRHEKIGEYETDIYTFEMGAVSATYWFAKDFPDSQKILDQMEAFQSRGLSMVAEVMLPGPRDFPGFPVRTRIKMGKDTVTNTLVSVKETDVPASAFKVPGGYHELPQPSLEPVGK